MLLASWRLVLVAYLTVTAARFVVVAIVGALLRRTREPLPSGWVTVLSWGGVRGALSMVLVLATPDDFPLRDILQTMTFGVVLLSLLVQGSTMSWLVRYLGIASAASRSGRPGTGASVDQKH